MDAIDRVDCVVGERVEQAVRAHHRRRLARVGWEAALDAPPSFVAESARPAQSGHEIEIFVDGAEAFPAMLRELRRARQRVCLAGWFFSAAFALEHRPGGLTLDELVEELGARVDVCIL
ncbi:MAG: phospholipase, partial [Gaiellales bacterium]